MLSLSIINKNLMLKTIWSKYTKISLSIFNLTFLFLTFAIIEIYIVRILKKKRVLL